MVRPRVGVAFSWRNSLVTSSPNSDSAWPPQASSRILFSSNVIPSCQRQHPGHLVVYALRFSVLHPRRRLCFFLTFLYLRLCVLFRVPWSLGTCSVTWAKKTLCSNFRTTLIFFFNREKDVRSCAAYTALVPACLARDARVRNRLKMACVYQRVRSEEIERCSISDRWRVVGGRVSTRVVSLMHK